MIALYKDPTGQNIGSFVHEESLGNVLECAGEDGASVKREKEQVQQQIQQLETQLDQLRVRTTMAVLHCVLLHLYRNMQLEKLSQALKSFQESFRLL